jgi:prepilin-type N-terminal cleavage/methylation domain-containing protein/prepilin-type processing-associated H-X9-DG protein
MPARRLAFTLIELLVVLSIISLLAALLAPVLNRAKAGTRQVVCLNNLKQLGAAFDMYQADFNGAFPGPSSRTSYGPHPEDWIWWQRGRDFRKSSIIPCLGQADARLFRCPQEFLRRPNAANGERYEYSYSLTSFALEEEHEPPANPGMASVFTEDAVYLFKGSQINSPARKIMLCEENELSIDDGRWVPAFPSLNGVTTRHANRGTAAFADGHGSAVTREVAADLANSLPAL